MKFIFNSIIFNIIFNRNQHGTEYLQSIAEQEIKNSKENFKVTVGSFVMDNAGDIFKMRKCIQNNPNLGIWNIPRKKECNAHILNLFSKDVFLFQIEDNVIKIIKHFRNIHLPATWYKQASKKQLMPIMVCWNTVYNSIDSFLKNRGVLIQVCQNKKIEINKNIYKMVNDINFANTW